MESVQKTKIHCETEEENEIPQSFAPCRVCNGPTSGIHYGVYTCDACKGFYHRSLRSSSKYVCAKDSTCLLQYGKGMMCRLCRFKKCLEVGMAVEAIRIGRYTTKRKKDVSLEKKRLKVTNKSYLTSQAKQNDDLAPPLDLRHNSGITNSALRSSEFDEVEKPTLSDPDSSQEKYYENTMTCGSMSMLPAAEPSTCSRPIHNLRLNNSALSSSTNSDLSDHGSFYKNSSLPDSPDSLPSLPIPSPPKKIDSNLSKFNGKSADIMDLYADREAVMKMLLEANQSAFGYIYKWSMERLQEETENHHEWCVVRSQLFGYQNQPFEGNCSSIMMDSCFEEDLRIDCMAKLFGDSDTFRRNMIQYCRNIPGFRSLSMDDKVKLIKNGRYEFDLIMLHQQCNTELGVFRFSYNGYICRNDMLKSDFKQLQQIFEDYLEGCKKLQALDLCIEECVILLAMAVMAPDRVKLKEHEKIYEIHWNLAQILLNLLKKRSDTPNLLFAKLIDFSTWFRQCEMKSKLWVIENSLHPSIFHQSPLTREIIRDDTAHHMDFKD